MKVSFNSTRHSHQLMRSKGASELSSPSKIRSTVKFISNHIVPMGAAATIYFAPVPFVSELPKLFKLQLSGFGFAACFYGLRKPIEKTLHYPLNKKDPFFRAGSLVQYLCEDVNFQRDDLTMNPSYKDANLQLLSSTLKRELQKYETLIASLHSMVEGLERVHFEEVNDKLIQEAHGNINAFVGRFIHPRISLINSRSIALQKQGGDTKEVDTVQELFVEANRRCVAIRNLLHSVSSYNGERVRFPEL